MSQSKVKTIVPKKVISTKSKISKDSLSKINTSASNSRTPVNKKKRGKYWDNVCLSTAGLFHQKSEY